ncbi:hypothetical protein K3555_06440 [Leisingera sp. M527]|uniref:hypothetical protein n=1 Tax=unclassified Leisingera TaxID=2614906 RepID=UPI0021A48B4A|nr:MULTISPECIES: hypothetical protein [unclassified Leisingera]UWQ34132.1 hypothetical protein K3555_06440 [Leisingera sp. M527]
MKLLKPGPYETESISWGGKVDFKKLFLIAVLGGSTAIVLMSQAWADRHPQSLKVSAQAAKSL